MSIWCHFVVGHWIPDIFKNTMPFSRLLTDFCHFHVLEWKNSRTAWEPCMSQLMRKRTIALCGWWFFKCTFPAIQWGHWLFVKSFFCCHLLWYIVCVNNEGSGNLRRCAGKSLRCLHTCICGKYHFQMGRFICHFFLKRRSLVFCGFMWWKKPEYTKETTNFIYNRKMCAHYSQGSSYSLKLWTFIQIGVSLGFMSKAPIDREFLD